MPLAPAAPTAVDRAAPTALSANAVPGTPPAAPVPAPPARSVAPAPGPRSNEAAGGERVPSQSARPTATPAAQGGAGGSAATPGLAPGQVNLDGSSPAGTGVAPMPAGAVSAPLRLDLHGGVIGPGMGRSRSGLLPVVPAPAEQKSKLESDIEKAAKADCKTAHAENGLLAVIPLAKDAITGKGCKW